MMLFCDTSKTQALSRKVVLRNRMREAWILTVLGVLNIVVERCDSLCQIGGNLALCDGLSLTWIPKLPSHITRVSLSNNYIGEVNETSFAGQEQLERVDFGTQRTARLVVRSNAFRGLSNLTYLHLGHVRTLVLEISAFEGLTNLRNLDLLFSGLDESILQGQYLRPLESLETLDLFGNNIRRIRPALFFRNMTKLREINLTLNAVSSICEVDLLGFWGKHFNLLNLSSIHLSDMNQYNTVLWKKCGNPFRNMSMRVLDLSLNGFNAEKARLFFKATEGTNIHSLVLSSNTMGQSFEYSNMKDPDKKTFEGLGKSNLRNLDLSKNFIFSLQFSVFRALKEAEEITLSHNKINQIQRGAFIGLDNLQRLKLSHNLMGEIYTHMFENLPNVVEIDLSNNHIGVIAHGSFGGLSHLTTLDLTGNSIMILDKFAKISNLQWLRLGDNKLHSVYGLSAFASTSIIIELRDNRLRDMKALYDILATLPYVQNIFLERNFISVCYPEHSVPPHNNLTFLDLQQNVLQSIWAAEHCLDMFDNLGKLRGLSLMDNLLRSPLPKGIFRGLVSLRVMDLSFNLLTHIQEDTFPQTLEFLDLSHNVLSSPDPGAFGFVRIIDLNNNPFYCDCSLVDFLTWMNETNTIFLSPKEGLSCEFPEHFLGVPLVTLIVDKCEEDDEQLVELLRLGVFTASSVIILLTVTCGLIFARLRGACFIIYKKALALVMEGSPRKAKSHAQEGFRYDAYLCFSNTDFRWVERALLKRLDSQFSDHNLLSFCFEARDFIPGEDHISNIRDAIWHSRKTVCVVSREFLKDGWCLEAFSLAQSKMLDQLRDILVVVVVGRIPHYQLMKYQPIRAFVLKREYLQWPEDSQDLEWFYDRLTLKIMKKDKTKRHDVELQTISQMKPE